MKEAMIIEHVFKTPPFEHQRVGIAALVKHPAFALFDEMGAGKSKQVIDAACILAEQKKINTAVVVAPASVRCVWLDKEIGEIKKHSWAQNLVYEFRQEMKLVWQNGEAPTNLAWIVTNYEFLRNRQHVELLAELLKARKTLLVLDESSYVKNRTAAQTKGTRRLRESCARCVLLNGTPVTNSPLDLWSQMQILDRKILGEYFNDNFYNFRYAYCTMRTQKFGSSRSFQQVVDYKNLGELAERIKPWVLRREKKDCLDLPLKLYTEREVALAPESWRRYTELKRDCIVSLAVAEKKRMEPNAAVRLMRLAQLTSGHIGRNTSENREVWLNGDWNDEAEDLSDEKLRWAVQYLTEESTAKAVIVWCRWWRERERLVNELLKTNLVEVVQIYGGQKESERNAAVQRFSETAHSGLKIRAVLVAQPHAGGHGLNLVAASEAVYLSNDFSLGMRLQSEDRCHRPGQRNAVTYVDVLATGPKGQQTIDHVIFRALREKKNIAEMTCAEWRKELENE